MQWTDQEQINLANLQRKVLEAIADGKGARIAFRSSFLDFEERKAKLLMDQFAVHLYDGRVISLLDKVHIIWSRASKWASTIESVDLCNDSHLDSPAQSTPHFYRVLAFVRVPGEVKGGMQCEGMFSVLSLLDLGCTDGDTAERFEPVDYICRNNESVGPGLRSFVPRRGKVLLYPIECLMPATAPPKAEKPRSISDEYGDELKWIAGLD